MRKVISLNVSKTKSFVASAPFSQHVRQYVKISVTRYDETAVQVLLNNVNISQPMRPTIGTSSTCHDSFTDNFCSDSSDSEVFLLSEDPTGSCQTANVITRRVVVKKKKN